MYLFRSRIVSRLSTLGLGIASACLICARSSQSTSTVTLVFGAFPSGQTDSGDVASGISFGGEIVGTGPDGTTVVLSENAVATVTASNQLSTTTIHQTFTAVEDSTHISYMEVEADTDGGFTLSAAVACAFDSIGPGQLATCLESGVYNYAGTAATIAYTTTGVEALITVAASTSSVAPSGSAVTATPVQHSEARRNARSWTVIPGLVGILVAGIASGAYTYAF